MTQVVVTQEKSRFTIFNATEGTQLRSLFRTLMLLITTLALGLNPVAIVIAQSVFEAILQVLVASPVGDTPPPTVIPTVPDVTLPITGTSEDAPIDVGPIEPPASPFSVTANDSVLQAPDFAVPTGGEYE